MELRAIYLAAITLVGGPSVLFSQTLPSATCPDPLPNQAKLPEIIACLQELQRNTVPTGAVVAFDLPTGCPKGWTEFSEAAGRFVIGAGRADEYATWTDLSTQNDVSLSAYAALGQINPPRDYRDAVGGEEKHTLVKDEIPSHNHEFAGTPVARGGVGDYSIKKEVALGDAGDFDTYTPTGTIGPTGGNGSHNNIPPYVALYYCKKTKS